MLQTERVQHFVFVTMSECAQIAASRPPSLLSRLLTHLNLASTRRQYFETSRGSSTNRE
jgi:hypothetical protein